MGMSTYMQFIYGVPESPAMAAARKTERIEKYQGCQEHRAHDSDFCRKCGEKSQTFQELVKKNIHPREFYGEEWVHDIYELSDLHIGLAVGSEFEAGQDHGFYRIPEIPASTLAAVIDKLKNLKTNEFPLLLLRIWAY